MFHRVLNSSIIDAKDAYFLRGTLISTARLEQVIIAYLNKGYNFKTVSELTNDTKQNQLVLTFDDGYFDTIQEAYAAHPGKRVGLISGGIGTGSPPRFGLRWNPNSDQCRKE